VCSSDLTEQTVIELTEKMQSGNVNLEESVVYLHKKEGVGLAFMYPAVSEIMGIDKRGAKKLLVKWLGSSV